MFPRDLLLMLLLTCILYYNSYAQESTTTKAPALEGMKDGEIMSIAMVCCILIVFVVLIPTAIYYKYFAKEDIVE